MSSRLDEIEAKRAARKAELQAQADEQRVTDIEALNDAEIQHGDTNVCSVDVPFTPGLPTLCIGRLPSGIELKRYRASLKVNGQQVDIAAANEAAAQLGRTVRVYPDAETFAKMCEARPDLASQLGSRATKLAQGKAVAEGND
jgi:hypothetical protein